LIGSYDNTSKELVRIPTVPGYGRMGFGLASTEDDKIIIVGGHNFDYETMQNVTMLDTQVQDLKWEDLPSMPSIINRIDLLNVCLFCQMELSVQVSVLLTMFCMLLADLILLDVKFYVMGK